MKEDYLIVFPSSGGGDRRKTGLGGEGNASSTVIGGQVRTGHREVGTEASRLDHGKLLGFHLMASFSSVD